MKEVLNNVLDYFILINEIEIVKNEKTTAVVEQNYPVAAELREQQVALMKKLPVLSDFHKWKEQLNKEIING